MKNYKDIPILFRGTMVKAILRNEPVRPKEFPAMEVAYPKTQTRRLPGLEELNSHLYNKDNIGEIKFREGLWHFWAKGAGSSALPIVSLKCPYGQKGDHLWVKESWRVASQFDDVKPIDLAEHYGVCTTDVCYLATDDHMSGKGRPSIFLPKRLSRISLEVEDVRVERIQQITDADAKAEGVEGVFYCKGENNCEPHSDGPFRKSFQRLWSNVNGHGSWMENDFVWVVKFKRIIPPTV